MASGYLGCAILRLAVAGALRLIKEQGLASDEAGRLGRVPLRGAHDAR